VPRRAGRDGLPAHSAARRTIDAHLRRVFTKLGVRSRTQLARIELNGDTPSAEALPAVV
jgi:hypothetical protein